MRFSEFKQSLLEASGGMWNRMAERRSGKPIVFLKNGETLDLLDVKVFPQDPYILSYEQEETNTKNLIKPNSKNTQPPPSVPPTPPAAGQEVTSPTELERQKDVREDDTDQPLPLNKTQTMLNDVSSWIKSVGASVEYAQSPTSSDGAAMVVILGGTEQNGAVKKLAFVNWYKQKTDKVPPVFWKTIRFEEATGWVQGNAGKSATSKAALIRIGPSDLLDAQIEYKTRTVPNMVARGKLSLRTDVPRELITGVPEILDDLLSNSTPTPTQGLDKFERELEVVLGETAAPIALMTGNRVSGAYNDVAQQLLRPMGLTWGDFTTVIYGKKGGKIEDCSMYAGETKLMVSSKDSNGGAAASLTGFMETLENLPDQFGPGTEFEKKYKDILSTLNTLYNNKVVMGILKASLELGFIDETELKYIVSIYGKKTGSIKDAKRFINLSNVLKAKGIKGTIITNAKGQQVQSKQGVEIENFKYQFGYHLLGNLAVMLQKHFAKDQDRVTNLFKSVLNRADMVQVHTKIGKNGQGLWFQDFKVTWPPTFNGKIVILADHYTAAAPANKKISFKFN